MLQWLIACTFPEERARQLGVAMVADPVIRPYLRHLERYSDYARFVLAHRGHWEESDQFVQRYEPVLCRLAERVVAGAGLDRGSTLEWDANCTRAAHQLRHIMWSAWEHRVRLQALYAEARATMPARAAAEVLPKPAMPAAVLTEHVATSPPAPSA